MAAITNAQIIELIGDIETARYIDVAMQMISDTRNINMNSRAGRRLIEQIEKARYEENSFVKNVYLRKTGDIAFHLVPGLHNDDAQTAKFAGPFREFMQKYEPYGFELDPVNPGIVVYKKPGRYTSELFQLTSIIFNLPGICSALQTAANNAKKRKGWLFKKSQNK